MCFLQMEHQCQDTHVEYDAKLTGLHVPDLRNVTIEYKIDGDYRYVQIEHDNFTIDINEDRTRVKFVVEGTLRMYYEGTDDEEASESDPDSTTDSEGGPSTVIITENTSDDNAREGSDELPNIDTGAPIRRKKH